MTIKEQYEKYKLDELCKSLTLEITDLSTAENKLKLAYVLVHIIDESQKALFNMDTSNLVNELRSLIEKACETSEKQIEIQKLRHTQNKQVKDIIDGTNDELNNLDRQIESLLSQYESVLTPLINYRNSLSLPEREVAQK